jgi:signal transduction histidine kinase
LDTVDSFEISNTQTPREVLEHFISSLDTPIKTITDLSTTLQTFDDQERKLGVYSQLKEHVSRVFKNIHLVIGYLNAYQKLEKSVVEDARVSEVEGLAKEMLSAFAYELRHPMTMLQGYADLFQLKSLPQDTCREIETNINTVVIRVEELHLFVKNSWKEWLESKEQNLTEDDFELIQTDQEKLLKAAQEKFLDGSFLAKTDKEKCKLFQQSSDLFEKAMTLGPIPKELIKIAELSKERST